MEELAVKIEHVSKEYRLGTIGGGTLKGDLQTWWAHVQGKEDPNSKIGSEHNKKVGERFLALDDINLEIKKGEAIGIIGHNGAGKSTLLKLLSRVTAPTKGRISIDGRIASMLEVGTGFHPEMTGRENVYLNGAILGMTRNEIDKKFEEIVEFAEIRQFIDTPVKRYSSGMYVKLAFSVAAHLDSEIMVMDEVLAVGDMAFQKKCLDKMRNAAKEDGRTVLYVSHNMSTIRALCDRCIVMNHGHIIYSGDVEEAVALYLGHDTKQFHNNITVTEHMRDPLWANPDIYIEELSIHNSDGILVVGDKLNCTVSIQSARNKSADVLLRIMVKTNSGAPVSMSAPKETLHLESGDTIEKTIELNLSSIVPGTYSLSFVVYETGALGTDQNIDVLRDIVSISIIGDTEFNHGMSWEPQWWGNVNIGDLKVLN